MSITSLLSADPWLPHSLPPQLAALGASYRDALEHGGARGGADMTGIGWRLYAAVFFASSLAPLQHVAALTSLSVAELGGILADYADDSALQLTAA